MPRHVLLPFLLCCACQSNNGPVADARIDRDAPSVADARSLDAGSTSYRVAPLTELPLLSAPSAFNHSAEVTIAAQGNNVVVAAIQMLFAKADSFDTTGFRKHVGVAASSDRGDSFGPAIDPGGGNQTTDPVVRVSQKTGEFFLTVWDTENDGKQAHGSLLSSTDGGKTWGSKARISFGDKQWLVVDDAAQAVWIAAVGGVWKYGFDGNKLAEGNPGISSSNAALTAGKPVFLSTAGIGKGVHRFGVYRWDGVTEPALVGPKIAAGEGQAERDLNTSASIGETAAGEHWIVRTIRGAQDTGIFVQLRSASDGQNGRDVRVSAASKLAYHPAAATDAQGRLHVLWYESDASSCALKYTRSLGTDYEKGFITALTIDDQACPVAPWYPTADTASGGRRLREYVDMAVSGNRAHLTWTRAKVAPSRGMYTYVEFPDA